jgi:hypothetical protein
MPLWLRLHNMNKIHVTKKQMRDNYYILGVSYCKLQFLLNYTSPVAYSTGAHGWACDYYNVDGVLISTGYAPLSSKNCKSNYEMIKQYDDNAQKIVYDHKLEYEDKKNKVTALLNEFIKEALTQ